MLEITRTDKIVTDEPTGNHNLLNLDAAATGKVTLISNNEFSIQHIKVGPPAKKFNVKIYMDMDPDPSSESMCLIKEIDKVGADLELMIWVPDITDSFKKKVRIDIKNNEAANRDIYFFVSASDRGAMPFRKF